MKVLVKKLREDAKLPFKKHNDDFCYDLYAATDAMEVKDDEGNVIPNVWKYGTGLSFEIVRDSEPIEKVVNEKQNITYVLKSLNIKNSPVQLSIDARPRSSIYKTGLSLANACGTVDESYRGEVCAFFYHVVPSLPKYKKGDRIVQVKLGLTFPMDFEEVDELSETERGEGGFGSTGKN